MSQAYRSLETGSVPILNSKYYGRDYVSTCRNQLGRGGDVLHKPEVAVEQTHRLCLPCALEWSNCQYWKILFACVAVFAKGMLWRHSKSAVWIMGHHKYAPPPRLGLEKIRRWLVYTISWWICKLPHFLCTPPRGFAAPLWWCIYTAVFWAVCMYTKKWYTPAIFLFLLSPNPAVV